MDVNSKRSSGNENVIRPRDGVIFESELHTPVENNCCFVEISNFHNSRRIGEGSLLNKGYQLFWAIEIPLLDIVLLFNTWR